MISEYHLLEFGLPVNLEAAVNSLIKCGWQPLGPPMQRDGKLIQPMVKQETAHETH